MHLWLLKIKNTYNTSLNTILKLGKKFLFGSIGERRIVNIVRKQPSGIGLLHFSEINTIWPHDCILLVYII